MSLWTTLVTFVGVTTAKVILFLAMGLIAYKLAQGGFKKDLAKAKQIGHKYGLITLGLVVLWWILTPTGTADDIITTYLLDKISITYYILFLAILSAYLIWRMHITIRIYKK